MTNGKRISVLLALTLALTCLLSGSALAEEKRLSVVTTIFPIYDWAREIAGEKADLTMLLDSGVDLHSYQPTAADIMKIATSDVFIYVGGESDEWVGGALAESVNPDMKVLNLVVTGRLETYDEDGYQYIHRVDAQVEWQAV